MDFNQVLELVRTVSASQLTMFRYEEGNQKILMQRGHGSVCEAEGDVFTVSEAGAAQGEPRGGAADALGDNSIQNDIDVTSCKGSPDAVVADDGQKVTGNLVKSPLVGRFYTAPSEDAEPFVRVGDTVRKGQTLAIVEAMKLMNEIESEYDGVVTEILAENGQGVGYGQELFRIS